MGDESAAMHGGGAGAHQGGNRGHDEEEEGWGETPTAGLAGRSDRRSAAPGTAVKSRNSSSRTDGPRILSFASGPHTQPRPRPGPGPGPAVGSSPSGRRALSGSMGPLGGKGAARTLQLGGLPVTSASERRGEDRASGSRSIRRIDTAALELEAEAALGLRGVGRGRGRHGSRGAHAQAQVGMDDSAQFVDSDEAGTDSDSESDSGTEGGPEQGQGSGSDPGVLHVRRTASALNWSDSSDSDESSGDEREEEEE